MRNAALLAIAVGLVACSTSRGGSGAPPATEAGADATVDARGDATPPGDAAPGSWCTGAEHYFCDDFDTADAFTPPWGGIDTVFGTVDFDDHASTSPPRSLVARLAVPALTPGTYAQGMLSVGLPTDTSALVVRMQIAFDDLAAIDAGPDAAIVDAGPPTEDVIVVDLGGGYELALRLTATSGGSLAGALYEGTTPHPFTASPSLGGAFHPLELDIAIDHAKVTLDGNVVLDAPLTGQPAPPRTASVAVGTTTSRSYVAATVHVDDVTMDVTR